MMDKVLTNSLGNVIITKEVISTIAGYASIGTYGLVGMAGTSLKDGLGVLLKFENVSRGVEVDFDGEDVSIKLYIIVGYGMKISTIARNLISSVKYMLKEKLNLDVKKVDIVIQGVRVSQE